eukprot:TRINITY_DN7632_c0_g1_i1.p3 TRINITY_DN7632_c0_g1~~TRINITY_DN7632_c0_g1_i1.p3  ORF type:complete len:221 (-),score=28.93 TRINITY_DN7632_c0_g1_i1:1203-1865(-)
MMELDGLQASSMLTEIGTVNTLLTLNGTPAQSPVLTLVVKALRRRKAMAAPRRAAPIDKDTLFRAALRANTRVGGILAIAWLLASRVGDVRRLRFCDVKLTGTRLSVRWFRRKDWTNIGLESFADAGRFTALIKALLDMPRDSDDTEIGAGLTTANIAAALPRPYTAHSIRRGAAQWALQNGAPAGAVRALTLHATMSSLLRYAPMALREQQLVAAATLG